MNRSTLIAGIKVIPIPVDEHEEKFTGTPTMKAFVLIPRPNGRIIEAYEVGSSARVAVNKLLKLLTK